jgi:hypothetical protein
MIDKEYKSFYISHDYQQQSEKYDEINRYLIWTNDYSDVVAGEFKTIKQAKQWIDENGE